MRFTPRFPWRPAIAALSLLLGGCAISQQGGNTVVRLDADELTATRLQVFQVGSAEGVLRRTLDQQYQIKLYDRMKLIELGRIDNPRVVRAERVSGYDLIVLHAPTQACPQAHRLYELRGLAVGMYDINNTPGQCDRMLGFASDGQGWTALQERGNSERMAWSWSNGKLVRMRHPDLAAPPGREAGQAPDGGWPAVSSPAKRQLRRARVPLPPRAARPPSRPWRTRNGSRRRWRRRARSTQASTASCRTTASPRSHPPG